MATEYGFIYILGNESMPGIYKIGFTLGHPQVRMDQLSSATACPTPFYMVVSFGAENPRERESDIHQELSRFRVNESREFFRLTLAQIQDVFRGNADATGDLVYTGTLDWDVRTEEIEHEQEWKRAYFLGQECDPMHWSKRGRGFY